MVLSPLPPPSKPPSRFPFDTTSLQLLLDMTHFRSIIQELFKYPLNYLEEKEQTQAVFGDLLPLPLSLPPPSLSLSFPLSLSPSLSLSLPPPLSLPLSL